MPLRISCSLPILNQYHGSLLEGCLTETAIGFATPFPAVTIVEIGIDDHFDGIDNIRTRERRSGDLAAAGIALRIAAEGNLVVLLAFPVDAENTDVAHMMVAAGVDAARNFDREFTNFVLAIQSCEALADPSQNWNRARIRQTT